MILVRTNGVLCRKERIFPTTQLYSRWPCGRKLGSVTAPLLRLQVRISPFEWIYLPLLCVFYVLKYSCHQLTRGFLKNVACLSVIVKLRKEGGPAPLNYVAPCKKVMFHISNNFPVSNRVRSLEICLYLCHFLSSLSTTSH